MPYLLAGRKVDAHVFNMATVWASLLAITSELTFGGADQPYEYWRRYRYQPAADSNVALLQQILALAHRHHRCGAGMIYLKLSGLTPIFYVRQLAGKTDTVTTDSKAA